jgi:hypothetical protein
MIPLPERERRIQAPQTEGLFWFLRYLNNAMTCRFCLAVRCPFFVIYVFQNVAWLAV